MTSRMLLYFLLLGGSVPPATLAQTAPPQFPCAQAETKQFDFWIGEWNLTAPGKDGKPAPTGRNVITRGFDGCVIEEHFSGQDAIPLRGMSVSVFNPRTSKWQQTWVDNQGGYLDFIGGFDGKQMVLSREGVNKQGQKIWQRMVWKNITPNSFDWSWESSTDGKEWQVNWPIHYEQAKQ